MTDRCIAALVPQSLVGGKERTRGMPMSYSLDEHRHRFAAWSAARAAQRGLANGSVDCIVSALEVSGLREAIEHRATWPKTDRAFDKWHRHYGRRLLAELRKRCPTATYGRAAKVMAIYLKSMVVLSEPKSTPLRRLAHPPLDNLLLGALARNTKLKLPAGMRAHCRSVKWTTLDEASYFGLITMLRQADLATPEFWKLERYWKEPL